MYVHAYDMLLIYILVKGATSIKKKRESIYHLITGNCYKRRTVICRGRFAPKKYCQAASNMTKRFGAWKNKYAFLAHERLCNFVYF